MSVQHDSDRDPAESSGEAESVSAQASEPESSTASASEPESTTTDAPPEDHPAEDRPAEDHPADDRSEDRPADAVVARSETVEARPGHGLPAYRPPPSPAYAAPPAEPATASTRVPPLTTPTGPPPPDRSPSERRLGWQLLIAGLFLVVVAGAVAALAIQSDGGGTDDYTFGDVSEITGDVTVRPGIDDEIRTLAVGDEVVTGWQVEVADGGTAIIDLAGGGVLRVDSGARVRFVDLAVDPDTGDRARASEPALDLSGGRAWFVPGKPADDAPAIRAHIVDGVVASDGHPVAIDCTDTCTVEAPTGGVTVTTEDGVDVTPTTNELLRVGPGPALDLTIAEAASTWARQNLDADEQAGLSPTEVDDAPGIVESAVIDGTYAVAITVVGPPTGDPIPLALQYPDGETYALDLAIDGSSCDEPPCSLTVTSEDGLSGTAHLREGEVALTFGLPINCLDETQSSVVLPGIGSTAVNATLTIAAVDFDGERWHARRVSGTGTIAATMSTTCNPGDVLGTATSPITLAGS